jgi:predicted transcriptional regulator
LILPTNRISWTCAYITFLYDEFIQEGGIENEKLERIFFYLEHEGLIYFYALGGDFYITDKGKEVIEKNRFNRIF